jgi:hypothetical protein
MNDSGIFFFTRVKAWDAMVIEKIDQCSLHGLEILDLIIPISLHWDVYCIVAILDFSLHKMPH